MENESKTQKENIDNSTEKLLLSDVSKQSKLFICSECGSDQTFLSEGGYVRDCLICGNKERVNK